MNLLLAAYLLTALAAKTPTPTEQSGIRTMPVARTPESNTIVLRIALPKDGEYVSPSSWIQFRIDGYALGTSSQFERASEIVESKMGQTVHVVIDEDPYFEVNEPALDPYNEGGYYYDTSYKFQVPYQLSEGMHTVRIFPARSFGESLKGDKTFQAIKLYVNSDENDDVDLAAPYITYNEPSNNMKLVEGKPILLDFYVSNTELSADGYKVRFSIDGKVNRILTSWQPYYIYGLKKGEHTVRLELLDETGAVVPGRFNNVSHKIRVN
jgi:hypothetical protein